MVLLLHNVSQGLIRAKEATPPRPTSRPVAVHGLHCVRYSDPNRLISPLPAVPLVPRFRRSFWHTPAVTALASYRGTSLLRSTLSLSISGTAATIPAQCSYNRFTGVPVFNNWTNQFYNNINPIKILRKHQFLLSIFIFYRQPFNRCKRILTLPRRGRGGGGGALRPA